jgi:two-component system sensor histidine kinase/response regulator
MARPITILIVDDEERNIRLLKAMLATKDYNLQQASQGEEALRIVDANPPDLILLDVMMPRMDGFEVCRRLKQDEKTRIIPIIMVTALSEKQHRIKALEVGADDFITKPVDHTELVVRVKSLLRIKSYHDELFQNFQEIASKNQKLENLEKIKDGLAHMIIHDLRNPLTAISTFLQLTLGEKESLPESSKERMERCFYYCQDLESMIQNLLDVGKMEEGKMKLNCETISLQDMITEILGRFVPTVEERKISLSSSIPGDIPAIPGDRSILKRVVANLVENAIRYTPQRGKIEVGAARIPPENALCISVKDSGNGLPAEYHHKIFDKFEQVKFKKEGARAGSSGLGLTFCKMAVEAHGGRIWVESEGEGKGCAFFVSLPIDPIFSG